MVRKRLLDVTGRHIAVTGDRAGSTRSAARAGSCTAGSWSPPARSRSTSTAWMAWSPGSRSIDGGSEYDTAQEFHRTEVTGATRLDPGERRDLPFRYPVPWETPLTRPLRPAADGSRSGCTPSWRSPRAVGHGGPGRGAVAPPPTQEQILAALAAARFPVGRRRDRARAPLRGRPARPPFYQEIEFDPAPPAAPARLNQLRVDLLADAQEIQVVLEVDKPGRCPHRGPDRLRPLHRRQRRRERTRLGRPARRWLRRAVPARGRGSRRAVPA